jgi:hypothetical protein
MKGEAIAAAPPYGSVSIYVLLGASKRTVATIAVWIFRTFRLSSSQKGGNQGTYSNIPETNAREQQRRRISPLHPMWSIEDRIDMQHRLTGLKQTTLVPVALRVSYADITTRPAIERARWRDDPVGCFSVSWLVASFWAAEASRGWSGDGVDEDDEDMAVS